MKKLIFAIQFIVVISASIFFVYAQQPEEKITNTLGMEFVLIPHGQFMMGSPKDEPGQYTGERPHPVNLTNPF